MWQKLKDAVRSWVSTHLFLSPLILLAIVVILESVFDWIFFGQGSSTDVRKLVWSDTSKDIPAEIRETTARLIVQVADVSLFFAVLATAAGCLWLVIRLWKEFSKARRICLTTAFVICALLSGWRFILSHPFDDSLTFALTRHASEVLDSAVLDFWRCEFSVVVVIMLLFAGASAFVAAKKIDQTQIRDAQLRDLTILLFLAAFVVLLFMFRIGATMVWVASVLPQGEDGDASLIRQLALAFAINYGVFSALVLAVVHVSSVWVVTSQICLDQLGNDKTTTATEHFVRIGIILSPILAGIPLTKLLGVMTS